VGNKRVHNRIPPFICLTGRVIDDVSYGELRLEKGGIISGNFSPIVIGSETKEPPFEAVLGRSERPTIVHRIEPSRPGNVVGSHGKLPAADYCVAS
jgi:hypothetical protein